MTTRYLRASPIEIPTNGALAAATDSKIVYGAKYLIEEFGP